MQFQHNWCTLIFKVRKHRKRIFSNATIQGSSPRKFIYCQWAPGKSFLPYHLLLYKLWPGTKVTGFWVSPGGSSLLAPHLPSQQGQRLVSRGSISRNGLDYGLDATGCLIFWVSHFSGPQMFTKQGIRLDGLQGHPQVFSRSNLSPSCYIWSQQRLYTWK